MRELRWPMLIFLLCLPVILFAVGVRMPWQADRMTTASPLPLQDGDREIAWIHTTTNANTWERFVTGVMRAQLVVDGLHVDDRRAFLDTTTAVPELVLTRDGSPGRVRIRWYKLQNELSSREWVRALAARRPAPLAVIGGGSTDRALDLARAMAEQTAWLGDRPPLLITTATADYAGEAAERVRLVDIYDDRTFRFCFTNSQMVESLVDFIWQSPDLWPTAGRELPRGAVAGGAAAWDIVPDERPPVALSVVWADDPYSVDLNNQFAVRLCDPGEDHRLRPAVDFQMVGGIPHSIGGLNLPNQSEAMLATQTARLLAEYQGQRVLMVLSAGVQPARRFLRAVLEANPSAANRLVVATGDGIPVNAVLRDGDFAWPIRTLPVPLVLFAHNNPSEWDDRVSPPDLPREYQFRPPNGTEEAMHFRQLAVILAQECFPPGRPALARGDELIAAMTARRPAFFDADGERLSRTGEYVVVVSPRPEPVMTVWVRETGRGWKRVSDTPLDSRTRPQPVEGGP